MSFELVNWQAIASIVAAILSGAFALVAYVTKRNSDRKRVLRATLFSLLEIWFQLRNLYRIDYKQLIDLYVKELQAQVPGLVISESDLSKLDAVARKMVGTASAIHNRAPEFLVEVFEQSIRQLAEVEPILAFRMSANHNIKSAIEEIDQSMRDAGAELISDPTEAGQVHEMIDDAKEYLYEDATSELEKNIKRLARKVGLSTYLSTKYLLWRKRGISLKEVQPLIKRYVSKVIVPKVNNSGKHA